MLKTGDRIGIVGGGQLGRMLAIAAGRLGFKTSVLDPQENAPAFEFADRSFIAAYDDPKALKELADLCDVITYEFENVPVTAFDALSGSVEVHPNTTALATSQDRVTEKTFFNTLDIQTAPWFDITSPEALETALAECGGMGIIKTRRFGYDGKGQIRVNSNHHESISEAKELCAETPCILEGFIEFTREISIIAARSRSGEVKTFDIAENVHRDGILHTSTVPASITDETRSKAMKIAEKTLSELEYVGVMGIEFFVNASGDLMVNEFAPRVHNSGHWTEAACTISQFEQHIRAVAGLPLGSTRRHSNCRMENLIGHDMDKVPEILQMDDTMLHLYGKAETRDGRKMGHFTQITPKSA
jgi:5-(carboxyamino)imidazole ribonucleotide synthase